MQDATFNPIELSMESSAVGYCRKGEWFSRQTSE